MGGPKGKDGKDIHEKPRDLERGIENLSEGFDKGMDYAKINQFGTLLANKRVQDATFHNQNGFKSTTQNSPSVRRDRPVLA